MITDAELAEIRAWFICGDPTGEGMGMVLVREVEALKAEATRHANERDGLAVVNKHANERIGELRAALRSLVKHWDEFGPEHGLDEAMHKARAALGDDHV